MISKFIRRCAHCEEIILTNKGRYKCDECGKEFCCYKCKGEHKCDGLPELFIPWEHDDELCEEDGDKLTSVLMEILERDRNNLEQKIREGKITCLICEQVKPGVSEDNPYSVCTECFKELRAEFLKIMKYEKEKSTEIAIGYRIFKMPTEFYMNTKRLTAILLAKKQYAKRRLIRLGFETPRKKGKALFELYDLKFWEVPEPTILHYDDNILEFTPGCYLIVADE